MANTRYAGQITIPASKDRPERVVPWGELGTSPENCIQGRPPVVLEVFVLGEWVERQLPRRRLGQQRPYAYDPKAKYRERPRQITPPVDAITQAEAVVRGGLKCGSMVVKGRTFKVVETPTKGVRVYAHPYGNQTWASFDDLVRAIAAGIPPV